MDVLRVEAVAVANDGFTVAINQKLLEVPTDVVALHVIVEQVAWRHKMVRRWRTIGLKYDKLRADCGIIDTSCAVTWCES